MTKHVYFIIGVMMMVALGTCVPDGATAAPLPAVVSPHKQGGGGGGGSWGIDSGPWSDSHYDCGYITCTLWFSWRDTQSMNNRLNGPHGGSLGIATTGVGGVFCGIFGTPVMGGVCGVTIAAGYAYVAETFKTAVSQARCVYARTFAYGPVAFYEWGVYKDSRCK